MEGSAAKNVPGRIVYLPLIEFFVSRTRFRNKSGISKKRIISGGAFAANLIDNTTLKEELQNLREKLRVIYASFYQWEGTEIILDP